MKAVVAPGVKLRLARVDFRISYPAGTETIEGEHLARTIEDVIGGPQSRVQCRCVNQQTRRLVDDGRGLGDSPMRDWVEFSGGSLSTQRTLVLAWYSDSGQGAGVRAKGRRLLDTMRIHTHADAAIAVTVAQLSASGFRTTVRARKRTCRMLRLAGLHLLRGVELENAGRTPTSLSAHGLLE